MNASPTKRILITGGQGALGSVVVGRFLRAGHHIVGTVIPGSSPEPGNVEWLSVDLTNSASVKSVLSAQKPFDVLVHCAGGFRYAEVQKTTDEDIEFLFNTNLKSAFYLIREVLPAMIKRNFGRIVLVSSKATSQPGAGVSAYAASKAGLNALVASLAEEVKPFNITVNAVLPSTIDTPANRKAMSGADPKKWVQPSQLAEIIYSLTDEFGDPVHGALIPVAGRV